MNLKHYILEPDGTIKAVDLTTWALWFETPARIIAQDHLPNKVFVSTVFLGIDHRFGDGTPLLFETMIFGLPDEYQRRYATKQQAREGHARALAFATNATLTQEAPNDPQT